MTEHEPQPAARKPDGFLSTHVDAKRIFSGLLVGIPGVILAYAASTKVLEATVGEIQRRLDTQRDFFLKQNDAIRSEIKAGDESIRVQLHDDMLDVRTQVRDLREHEQQRRGRE